MNTFLRLIIAFLFVTAPLVCPVYAQAPILVSDIQAAQYIGQNATVEGIVTAITTSRKGNTFINFGGVYPNQTFTGWIPARTALASDPSIESLQGKRIKITGTIELYHGKPESRIVSKDQITED